MSSSIKRICAIAASCIACYLQFTVKKVLWSVSNLLFTILYAPYTSLDLASRNLCSSAAEQPNR
ncbi:hypothetical protein FLL60_16105 [Vibrio cholerae]|nr:hypothetical protein FLL60_16105 [Vibrio cholerae]